MLFFGRSPVGDRKDLEVVNRESGKKMLSENKFELYVGKTTSLENTTLVLEGNARIDGKVTGKISAKQLEIGPEGTFVGNVDAEKILVDGVLDSGDQAINSSGIIEIRETGKVTGNVHYASLVCMSGGIISGSVAPLEKKGKDS